MFVSKLTSMCPFVVIYKEKEKEMIDLASAEDSDLALDCTKSVLSYKLYELKLISNKFNLSSRYIFCLSVGWKHLQC